MVIHLRSTAQISNAIFIGAATIDGGGVYTYKLQISDSNGKVKGYSVTDISGANETKTAVYGTIDAEKKILNYRETRIIYTKSTAPKADFCYLQAHLKVANMKGATTLKGKFKGYKDDGKTPCATGKLVLVSAQDVLDKLLELAPKDSIPEAAKVSNETKTVYESTKEVPDQQITKLPAGKTLQLSCASKIVNIELWDAKTIDGDIISLYKDEALMLDNYTISGVKKQVTVDMKNQKVVTLRLVAISEGSEPTNTTRMHITSGSDSYFVDATTTIGKDVVIFLKSK